GSDRKARGEANRPMAETKPDKPGFLSRLFGRRAEPAPQPEPAPQAEPAPEAPQAEGRPEEMPSPPTTAADDLAAAPPTVTQASPDTRQEEKLPPELAGADLQPVEGLEPEGGGPTEPIPRPAPEPDPAQPVAEAAPPAEVAPLAEVAPPIEATPQPEKRGWWQRLTEGMRRTSYSLTESVTSLFTKRKLDYATLDELE